MAFERVSGSTRTAPLATPIRFSAGFARALPSYWLDVFPRLARELRSVRATADAIPDPLLRTHALRALAKQGNMEGAAAFATFAPRAYRDAVVRATVSFQTAYNHLDAVSEHPAADPYENSRSLHTALLVALDPTAIQRDYYLHNGRRDDGGYLATLVETCRQALGELPSYARVVAPAALRSAERVVAFQVLQASAQNDERAGRRTAFVLAPSIDDRPSTRPADLGLRWWETQASAGSSLGVHVMIATAAERHVSSDEVAALESAYFPWIGALHSMLDHLVDIDEDRATGQRNLIGYYDSPERAAERMGFLAERALSSADALAHRTQHKLILAAMAGFYLSRPQANAPDALPATRAVLDALGPLVWPPIAVFKVRRSAVRARRATGPLRGRPRSDSPPGRVAAAAWGRERRLAAAWGRERRRSPRTALYSGSSR